MSDEPPITVVPGVAHCTFAIDRNPLRRSPRPLRRRLNSLSDRHGGARAITQSTREIPQAYRAHYGIERSPAEELTIKQLIRGQYRSRGVLRDALLLATVDTEVGVWALDADLVTGALYILDDAIADDAGPLAALFADPKSVRRATRRLTLYALTAPGIPELAIEEALYTAWDVLSAYASRA
ncbi:MAG TPA: hypothetical protein VI300_10210 [Solirubrobacter sp.]